MLESKTFALELVENKTKFCFATKVRCKFGSDNNYLVLTSVIN